MSALVVTEVVAAMACPSSAWRRAAMDAPAGDHARLAREARCLHVIEAGGAASRPAPERLRVVAWNAERLKHGEASAAVLAPLDADVLLLTEVDRGMARSGNRHTVRDLADALGMGWRYAVEFIELGLGDGRETAAHAGQTNVDGLHGAAILSRVPLEAERLIRLGDDGAWFDGSRKDQRRVGGRIALAADVRLGGVPVRLVAVHLESHSDAAHRAAQTRLLTDASAPAPALLLAGDFNTKEAGGCDGALPAAVADEPLFAVLAEGGFTWADANALGPTQRLHPYQEPRPLLRLDWAFTRGLRARKAMTVAALAADGTVLSDHEILVCDLEPA